MPRGTACQTSDMIDSERVEVPTPDGPMPAEWFGPTDGSVPVIVVCQEIFGVTDYIRRRCRDLADAGYAVLAPHFYWRLSPTGDAPEIAETDENALQQAMGLAQQLDFAAATADGVAAVAYAREHGTAVGLVGFCFGGGLAFAIAAQAEPDALVSYYGSGLPGLLELAPRVTAPILHHFGDADSFIDADAQARVRDAVTANTEAEWITHPGADHAFDNDVAPWHHPEASARAWQATLRFLADRLPAR